MRPAEVAATGGGHHHSVGLGLRLLVRNPLFQQYNKHTKYADASDDVSMGDDDTVMLTNGAHHDRDVVAVVPPVSRHLYNLKATAVKAQPPQAPLLSSVITPPVVGGRSDSRPPLPPTQLSIHPSYSPRQKRRCRGATTVKNRGLETGTTAATTTASSSHPAAGAGGHHQQQLTSYLNSSRPRLSGYSSGAPSMTVQTTVPPPHSQQPLPRHGGRNGFCPAGFGASSTTVENGHHGDAVSAGVMLVGPLPSLFGNAEVAAIDDLSSINKVSTTPDHLKAAASQTSQLSTTAPLQSSQHPTTSQTQPSATLSRGGALTVTGGVRMREPSAPRVGRLPLASASILTQPIVEDVEEGESDIGPLKSSVSTASTAASSDQMAPTTEHTSTGGGAVAIAVAPAIAAPNAKTLGFQFEDEHYIRTPGQHLIDIRSFLMDVDRQAAANKGVAAQRPALSAAAAYAQDMHIAWREMEQKVEQRAFGLTFPEGTNMEQFRMHGLLGMWRYVTRWHFHPSTIHCAAMNLNRAIVAYVDRKRTLTETLFAATVSACLRMALKHEESAQRNRPLREKPTELTHTFELVHDLKSRLDSAMINRIESEVINLLRDPLTPPSPLDFLERYLRVGGWPEPLAGKYAELAHYLVDLTLFAKRGLAHFGELAPSLVAGAALILSVKIVSADARIQRYEFWPLRLAVYSGYTMQDLSPAIKALSTLLRCKPSEASVLDSVHPHWGKQSWR